MFNYRFNLILLIICLCTKLYSLEQNNYVPSSRSPGYVKNSVKQPSKKRIKYLEFVKKLQSQLDFESGPFLKYIERKNSLSESELIELLIYFALKRNCEIDGIDYDNFELPESG